MNPYVLLVIAFVILGIAFAYCYTPKAPKERIPGLIYFDELDAKRRRRK